MGIEDYKYEKSRVENYNAKLQKQMKESKDAQNAQYAGLGYLDMNSKMLQMEQAAKYKDNAVEWAKREKEHKKRKEDIEKYWHKSTKTEKTDLERKTKGDNKNKDYYSSFSLKELELFVKNSDNKGNSQEFNDVATDLELFNAMDNKEAEKSELIDLLHRLSDSCDKYISSRRPISWNGRRRKAMIQQINDKVKERLQKMEGKIVSEAQASYKAIESNLKDTKNIDKAAVEKACKAKFDLVFQSLQGHIELTDEERKQIDKELTEIMKALANQEVDSTQSKTLSTRFFNAIGWAARKPKLSVDFSTDMKTAQVKIELYHTIDTINAIDDTAIGMVNQLKGKEDKRHYLSAGDYGKGTYTAARSIRTEGCNEKEAEERDKCARIDSQRYGKNDGAIMLTMLFNEKAKMIDHLTAGKLIKEFEKQYPKFSSLLRENEEVSRKINQKLHPAATVILAFFGYNTIHIKDASFFKGNNQDYYVTTDRSAFTIKDNYGYIKEEGAYKNGVLYELG